MIAILRAASVALGRALFVLPCPCWCCPAGRVRAAPCRWQCARSVSRALSRLSTASRADSPIARRGSCRFRLRPRWPVAPDTAAAVARLRALSEDCGGETLFQAPWMPIAYTLTGRRNSTRYDLPHHDTLHLHQAEEILDDLRTDSPDMIVMQRRYLDYDGPSPPHGPARRHRDTLVGSGPVSCKKNGHRSRWVYEGYLSARCVNHGAMLVEI